MQVANQIKTSVIWYVSIKGYRTYFRFFVILEFLSVLNTKVIGKGIRGNGINGVIAFFNVNVKGGAG